jgi:hypothetical protein
MVNRGPHIDAPSQRPSKRFEARWLSEPMVYDIVKGAWERAKASNHLLIDTLSDMHADLHEWDRTVLKGPKKRIDKLKKELEELRRGTMTDEALERQ